MDTINSPSDDASKIRRLNLEIQLEHGDLKLLAEKLGKNANYLSQLFSLKSKRSLSNKLARKIEEVLELDKGILDRNPVEIDSEADWAEENNRAQEGLDQTIKSNRMSDLAFELLQARIRQMTPKGLMITAAEITFDDQVYVIPILVKNSKNWPLLAVETTRSKSGLARILAQSNLLSSMSLTGCKHGLLATESDGQLLEKWFCYTGGKITLLNNKPNSIVA